MTAFHRVGGVLHCEGASLAEAADRFGTPLYVYGRRTIEDSYLAYQRAFAGVPHRICYALKANPSSAILRVLAALGAGADIVSGFELLAALRAGFPPGRIVFSGVGKTAHEIALAIERGVGEFNAESEDEIAAVSAAAVAHGVRAAVTLRVNPDIDARSHPYISTGLRENKFGVEIGRAQSILRSARALPGVEVVGVQCHIGSQITEIAPLRAAVAALVALTRSLMADGFPLRTIDLGGGLGVDPRTDEPPDVEGFAAAVLPLVKDLGLTVILEPGRSIVARSGVLLTRVLSVKETEGKTFVVVDAGMNDLLRPALYEAYHRVEAVLETGGPVRAVDVVGPVCETSDTLAKGRELPATAPGALLAVRDAGAYGYSMASNYNMRPRPAEVLVEDGRLRLIRRRETFEDLVGSEV